MTPLPFKPAGKSTKWEKDAIALLALISLADAQAATKRWDSLGPPGTRGMLDARVLTPDERAQPGDGWWFDPETLQYGKGPVLAKPEHTRQILAKYIDVSQKEFSGLGKALAAGLLSMDAWQLSFAHSIRDHQAVMAVAGAGGVENISAAQLKYAQGIAEYQIGRLQRFADQVAARDMLANTEQKVTQRSGSYVRAGRTTYEETRRMGAKSVFTQERRILTPADHCKTCVEQADLGWSPIGTLKPIGDSECRMNCVCFFDYGK